jgi:hypothetical protein
LELAAWGDARGGAIDDGHFGCLFLLMGY